jgi:hypothetical protein
MESKNNPKLQTCQRPFFKQALRSRSRDYILVTKIKSKKLAKFTKKDFQSLKTNHMQALNSQINQTMVSEVHPKKLR